jgi:hypothetical protein
MRRALIGLLIAATAAVPVASASAQRWDGGNRRAERQEQRAERKQVRDNRQQQRAQRQQRAESRRNHQPRSQQNIQARRERAFQASPGHRTTQQRMVRRERGPDTTYIPNRARYNEARQEQRQRNNWSQRSVRQRDGRRDGNWNGDRRYDGRRDGNWNERRYDGRRDGNWNSRRHSWNRGWRNDRRYDWHGYRNRNRHIYHVGRYYAPYRNYHYRRFSVGFFLQPLFFGSRYWISDPWHYRLPPAYPGTRWVRYYDDVLLVDMYSGEVIDVIYDFFW